MSSIDEAGRISHLPTTVIRQRSKREQTLMIEKIERVTYTSSKRPSPAQMSREYAQPGRQWIPFNGPYKDKLGTEHCASSDFEWVGLMFPGETEPRVFSLDDLQAAD